VPITVFGLVYSLPFMLFPLTQGIAMVPDDAARRPPTWALPAGASVGVDLPLAAPASWWARCCASAGRRALAESKLPRHLIGIASEMETASSTARTGRSAPRGDELILVIGALAITTIARIDLDAIMGRKR